MRECRGSQRSANHACQSLRKANSIAIVDMAGVLYNHLLAIMYVCTMTDMVQK